MGHVISGVLALALSVVALAPFPFGSAFEGALLGFFVSCFEFEVPAFGFGSEEGLGLTFDADFEVVGSGLKGFGGDFFGVCSLGICDLVTCRFFTVKASIFSDLNTPVKKNIFTNIRL